MVWLSPLSLIGVCWGLTFAMAALALTLPGQFDLLPVFMAREQLDLDAFTWLGALWLLTAVLALTAGDLGARNSLPPPRPRAPAGLTGQINLPRAAQITAWVNTLFLGVTLLWIALTAQQNGGLAALIALAGQDALGARDMLLDNKLFTGMRLFYAALPATGCLAAAILAAGGRSLPKRARRRCRDILILNTVALLVLPVVMSQRLLLLQFILSAYLVTCLIRRRITGLPWLILGAFGFLAVWVLREQLTNPQFHRSALDIGLQKLAFYFVNDLWNSFAPLSGDALPTLGAQTLHGLMVLSFTDGLFDPMLAGRVQAVEHLRGGGEFSLLTAPYVDFGLVGGALFLYLAGYLLRYGFHRAHGSLLWAAIYAQAGAALLFSSHGLYLTHQNCLFSLLVIAGICRLCRRKQPATAMQPERLPDHAPVFRSRRKPLPPAQEPVPLPKPAIRSQRPDPSPAAPVRRRAHA